MTTCRLVDKNWFVKGVKNNVWYYNVIHYRLILYNKIHRQIYSTSLPVHLKIFVNILYTACSCRSAKSGGEEEALSFIKNKILKILNTLQMLILHYAFDN